MDFPDFAVAVGEEGSDPLVQSGGETVRIDQYASSGHLDRQDGDLADVASLGVRVIRYGMPWRRTEPEPGRYDWTLWDQAFAACDRHRLVPIVDLLHFGLPDHLDGGFCDPTWIEAFVRYVDAFLSRYPTPAWFTPINEPGITAIASALFGVWNDRRTSREDYFTALGHLTLANLEAVARVRDSRDGWWIGSEGFGCNLVLGPDGEQAARETRAVQQLVWDLHLGLDPRPEVADALDVIDDGILDRIDGLAVRDGHHVVAGHDIYPSGVMTHGTGDAPALGVRELASAYDAEAREWFERYRRPFWVAETSNLGLGVERQGDWLAALVDALDAMRSDGLPVRGICWYSRGDQFDWQTMLAEPVGAVTEVGLFDHRRAPRASAVAFHALATRRRN